MSTDYYIACKKCKVAIDVASWGLGGFQFYRGEPDCMRRLHTLLEEHTIGEHDIGLITEHVIYDNDDYTTLRWNRSQSDAAADDGSQK